MRRFAAFAMLAAAIVPRAPAHAQGAPLTVEQMKPDPNTAATGYRVSKIINSSVVNDKDQAVGTVDDMIITSDQKVPYAILSVGGFLGVGTRLVAVPYSDLQISKDKIVLPQATRESLTKMPDFSYNPGSKTSSR